MPALGALMGLVGASLIGAVPGGRPVGAEQRPRHPAPDTYHWVLPAQHGGVEVADLHPDDCYVIQQAEGIVYFGEPWPELLELQAQLGGPIAHRVETADEHPECQAASCQRLPEVRAALAAIVEADGNPRDLRPVGHRPVPIDGLVGGAYSDVGSDERDRYRRAPEQRMAYRHLSTARRGNCYQAKVPRTLSIHIRDQQRRTSRTGVYSGFLYVEHHHDPSTGRVADVWAPAHRGLLGRRAAGTGRPLALIGGGD